MIRFTRSVQLYQDAEGKNPDEAAPVRVLIFGTATEATIFSDDAGTIPLAQPFLTNLLSQENPGQFTFVVSDGTYDIEVNGVIALASEQIFSQAVIPVIPVLPDIDIDNIRYSKLQNPLLSVLKKNKLEDVIAGSLTWVRPDEGTYEDRYGKVQTSAINEPRQEAAGWLIEGASENEALHARDLTDVVWVKVNATALKDAIGKDGVTNAASSLTATSANGTCFQAITLTSAERTLSFDVKRKAGTGTIEMTDDGGSTYTDITSFLSADTYSRFSLTKTQSNPTIGIRITTSGDAVEVDYNQIENLPFASSRIPTVASSVVRGADMVTVDVSENLPALSEDFSLTVCYKPTLLTATTQRFVDTTGSNLLLQSLSTGAVQFGGSGTFSTSSVSPTNDIDVALVSENGETTLYFNGLDDSPTPIPYVTLGTGSIHIGAGNSGIVPCYGHFLSFQLYDFALNADEVKFIS